MRTQAGHSCCCPPCQASPSHCPTVQAAAAWGRKRRSQQRRAQSRAALLQPGRRCRHGHGAEALSDGAAAACAPSGGLTCACSTDTGCGGMVPPQSVRTASTVQPARWRAHGRYAACPAPCLCAAAHLLAEGVGRRLVRQADQHGRLDLLHSLQQRGAWLAVLQGRSGGESNAWLGHGRRGMQCRAAHGHRQCEPPGHGQRSRAALLQRRTWAYGSL